MKNVDDLAQEFKVSKKVIYNHIHNIGLLPSKCLGGINYYGYWRVEIIRKSVLKENNQIKYYPLKTTETFHIYESKMNTL